jgi:hypothetical protein
MHTRHAYTAYTITPAFDPSTSLTDSSALIVFCAALPRLPSGPLTNSAAYHVSRSAADSSLHRGDGYAVVKKWDFAGYRSTPEDGPFADADLGLLEEVLCRSSSSSSMDTDCRMPVWHPLRCWASGRLGGKNSGSRSFGC